MADIGSITQQNSSSATAGTTTTEKNSLGQEDFLKLLVAQLQNQDPLNPTDATEFTAQLAQYSQLEQLLNLNSAMDQMTLAQNNSQRISALSLIGKEVLVSGNSFSFDQQPVEIGYRVDDTVTEGTLRINDSYGKTVETIELADLEKGNHTITWDGKNAEGELLSSGNYTIDIQPTGAAVTALVRAEVTGVKMEDGTPTLETSAGYYTIDEIHGAYDKTTQQPDATLPTDGEVTDSGVTQSPLQQTISAAKDGSGIIEDVLPTS
jgi:flagellar basal-body rod modification protein FlgD